VPSGEPLRVVVACSSAIPRSSQQNNRFTNLPEQERIMSGVNGDKARFNRVRRQNAAKRMRNRKLLQNAIAQAKAAGSSSEKKPVVA
jgi:hypothetical protein